MLFRQNRAVYHGHGDLSAGRAHGVGEDIPGLLRPGQQKTLNLLRSGVILKPLLPQRLCSRKLIAVTLTAHWVISGKLDREAL